MKTDKEALEKIIEEYKTEFTINDLDGPISQALGEDFYITAEELKKRYDLLSVKCSVTRMLCSNQEYNAWAYKLFNEKLIYYQTCFTVLKYRDYFPDDKELPQRKKQQIVRYIGSIRLEEQGLLKEIAKSRDLAIGIVRRFKEGMDKTSSSKN